MGRRTKLTPELGAEIVKSVRCGIDIESSCAREGVGRRTLYDWIKRAETGEEPFLSFATEMEAAQAEVMARITVNLIKASEEDWKAGAWLLERRKGSVYAPPKQRFEHDVIAKEVDDMSEEKLLEIARDALAARGMLQAGDDESDD